MFSIFLLVALAAGTIFGASHAFNAHAIGDDSWGIFAAIAGFLAALFTAVLVNRLKRSANGPGSENGPVESVRFVSHAYLLTVIIITVVATILIAIVL